MKRTSSIFAASALVCSLGLGLAVPALADGDENVESPFARTATYPVYMNAPEGVDPADETVAEISTVSEDGNTLIYTDAAGKRIGFLDISDPHHPKGAGSVSLAELGHADDQPTSVAVAGDYVLVVIDETGGDFEHPKGRVDVLEVNTREKVASIDLKGQPDSIAINKDGSIAAIAIENQRDEEREDVDGGLPQMPTGFVQTLKLEGDPSTWSAVPVNFTDDEGNVLDIVKSARLDTPEDLEPEYVSINSKNELAVTLQENNGVAIIDLNTNEITSVFTAGWANIDGIDASKDGDILPTESLNGIPREPDAIAWVDDEHVATANEGDWKGGSRGWTIFATDGEVVWDAGNSIEELANAYGLHNEKRAGKKGPEIEGLAVAEIDGVRYAFVASERSNFVAVYNVNDPSNPTFEQLLFTTNGPEGILPIPGRNLLAVSSETDDASARVRSAVNLYKLGADAPETAQPSIVSATQADGHAVPWTALGSLAGSKSDASTLYAASDSALDVAYLYTIDASATPALITERRAVKRDGAHAEGIDIEGLTQREDGGFWLASEGKTGDKNRLVRTDADLNIQEEIALPEDVSAHIGKWGLEGIDARVNEKGEEEVFVAIQRPLWKDPSVKPLEESEGNVARIGRYNTTTKEWNWYTVELTATDTKGDWMGLSELTIVDNTLVLIERDKLNGPDAKVKQLVQVALPSEDEVAAANGAPIALGKGKVLDVLPKLRATNGWTQEKLEGFTVAKDGSMYAVTDNDGLDDATGETVFLRLGKVGDAFDVASDESEQPSEAIPADPAPGNGDDDTDEGAGKAPEKPAPAPADGPSNPVEAPAKAPSKADQPIRLTKPEKPKSHVSLPRTGVDGSAYLVTALGALVLLGVGGTLVARSARKH
ncbi:esterase-like activity of phytase family protein [Dermabacter sp. Marseille-Q3180]|uniref:esterase-like activity of phytase family protein n=1 Tax=Dermabacter sp. Marseille-Q3180 TaxID=2758090 RepID=UPI002024F454|nr:esterase-like activity of phytase family protein [Dermabacter sp. Marseille-Q3180]